MTKQLELYSFPVHLGMIGSVIIYQYGSKVLSSLLVHGLQSNGFMINNYKVTSF
jgi:hypothetical protein